ncbi:SusD/RagB family nutrient-binding outer membrane lipoprotein [Polaribacter pectinis]|uniref:SusD/RagB family nutrient-binding outer membrane lipoprotein n=1 Tax=Polaribacter pectinis TaxID=2738844 RepID=A0A7G9L6K3_9FLAO|nr:SusD/RagB family nutrient-binding outer membrane lipoprotein [Polaribacter pectinis]QNM84252.1 SusD/RagB family nutrient-binding outer membrane lipoprotein [Polaribacter pectinis]
MKKILILIAAVIITSCSDNLESLNQNIKDPSEVPGESLFTGAQKNLVDQMVDLNVNNNNTKLWSQFLQETTYTDESNYDQVGRNIPGTHWSVLYKDVLKDLDEAGKVIAATTYPLAADAELTPNKLQVIEILKVYTYSILVETFGDVPYTESLDIENLLPKYDDGLTVYKDLVARLTAAINALDTSKGSFGSADNIYGGDVASWKKFAASLKLRMGILLSDVDNAFAKSTVESAVTSGVFTSNADNANFKYLSADPNTHPVHANLVLSGRHDFVAAETIVNMMNTLNDPRRALYFLEVPGGGYVGGEIGATSNYSSHSHVSAQVEAAQAPGVILDYSEVEFLLAEASARTFNVGGSAKGHYDTAIEASIINWGGTAADAATYLAEPSVDYNLALASSTAATPWKEVIGNQKWISLFNRGFEAWTSIRLLDFPFMITPADALSGYPNKYTYPVVEQTLNGANYSAAVSAIGTDTAEQKLFWDKN